MVTKTGTAVGDAEASTDSVRSSESDEEPVQSEEINEKASTETAVGDAVEQERL
jgi:hypothetical protein